MTDQKDNPDLPPFIKVHQKKIVFSLLALALLLGTVLRFYQLGEAGIGNTYYAAAVKSMLMNWKNFFFVAFEPGGSVSLDKPPLGYWVQAFSAYFLGLNGFALALPNAIAGVLSVFVVFKLVRQTFGDWAGLLAAFTLAITPIAIATERNNTIDGLLVFVLLLAAWAFMQSIQSGNFRWLLLGALLVGLGFNIKMLQALLPLPAFYAAYFFGAKHNWRVKLSHLTAASTLLLAVSLSWALVVDMIPASERPYVDSSSNNSVMSLIFGHNGLTRLTNARVTLDGLEDPIRLSPPGDTNANTSGNQPTRPSDTILPHAGKPPQPSAGLPHQMDAGRASGPGGNMDFGRAGTLRLFSMPLADEASWLLPFVLGGLAVLGTVLWRQPFDQLSIAVLMWAGWLLPEVLYFSYSGGLMHAYYLIMLAPPLSALTAMTTWALCKTIQRHPPVGWVLTCLLVGMTLAFQGYILWINSTSTAMVMIAAGILFLLGILLAAASKHRPELIYTGLALMLMALLVAPGTWSILTSRNTHPDAALPNSGPAQSNITSSENRPAALGSQPQQITSEDRLNQKLLNFLLVNTEPDTYLMATGRASGAAPYILATGRSVLTFGGFLGQYDVVSVEQLAALVEQGQLRFVLGQDFNQHAALAMWIQTNCAQIDTGTMLSEQTIELYDCRKE